MSELIISMVLDASVALLLSVTIYYCIKLNKRVQVLQDSKSELAHLIEQFDESTKQATLSIHEIHKASKKINENIQTKLDKANYLADDLAFMIERANKTADRIEQQISTGRSATSVSRSAEAREEPRKAAEQRVEQRPSEPSKVSQEYMQEAVNRARERTTLRASTASARGNAVANAPQKDAGKSSGIEAMMERISELRSGHQQAARPQRPMARLRTKSEEDLARAMKDTGKE